MDLKKVRPLMNRKFTSSINNWISYTDSEIFVQLESQEGEPYLIKTANHKQLDKPYLYNPYTEDYEQDMSIAKGPIKDRRNFDYVTILEDNEGIVYENCLEIYNAKKKQWLNNCKICGDIMINSRELVYTNGYYLTTRLIEGFSGIDILIPYYITDVIRRLGGKKKTLTIGLSDNWYRININEEYDIYYYKDPDKVIFDYWNYYPDGAKDTVSIKDLNHVIIKENSYYSYFSEKFNRDFLVDVFLIKMREKTHEHITFYGDGKFSMTSDTTYTMGRTKNNEAL